MNIGLYFGSFNPIHVGHLLIANSALNETTVDKIWFIVSPQNPLKKSNSLLNEFDRLHLVRLATEGDIRIKPMDIEFHLPKPSFTIDTLIYLKEKYPTHNFSVLLGSDSFQNIEHWKKFSEILSQFPLIIYKRFGFEINNKHNAQLTILNAPLIELSATQIRDLIKAGKSIRYLVPEAVREEIEVRSFFLKKN